MLARLNEELRTANASVDRTGSYLRIDPRGGGVESERAIKLLDQLGYRGEAIEKIDPPPDRWYGVDEVDELSQEESRILAERWIVEAQQRGLINDQQAAAARGPLASAVLGAIQEAASTGQPGRLGLDGLTAALSAGVETERREQIRNWIREKLP